MTAGPPAAAAALHQVEWWVVCDGPNQELIEQREAALVPDDGRAHVIPLGIEDLVIAPAFF